MSIIDITMAVTYLFNIFFPNKTMETWKKYSGILSENKVPWYWLNRLNVPLSFVPGVVRCSWKLCQWISLVMRMLSGECFLWCGGVILNDIDLGSYLAFTGCVLMLSGGTYVFQYINFDISRCQKKYNKIDPLSIIS